MAITSKANYFLFCENLVRDDKDRLTLVNIFDVITAEGLPVKVAKFVIVFSVRVTKDDIKDGKAKFRILLKNPDGKKSIEIEGAAKIEAPDANAVSSIDLSGKALFRKEGDYVATLFMNDELVADKVLSVTLKSPNRVEKKSE